MTSLLLTWCLLFLHTFAWEYQYDTTALIQCGNFTASIIDGAAANGSTPYQLLFVPVDTTPLTPVFSVFFPENAFEIVFPLIYPVNTQFMIVVCVFYPILSLLWRDTKSASIDSLTNIIDV